MTKENGSEKPIRILVADDHAIVREGMVFLASTRDDIEVVGQAQDGAQAVEMARDLKPDVILLDLMMPRMDGIAAAGAICNENPEARILVMTSFAEEEKVFAAIKAGALGYLLKDTSPGALIQAIHDVHRGESSLHPSIARKLIREMNQPHDLPPTADPLTEREVDVLKLVAQGLSNQEIGDRLFIAERTAGVHVGRILAKLHLANRTQAALYALREGLASLEDAEFGSTEET
jgi:two-component system, NarL family, response regulator LiaR